MELALADSSACQVIQKTHEANSTVLYTLCIVVLQRNQGGFSTTNFPKKYQKTGLCSLFRFTVVVTESTPFYIFEKQLQ